MWRRYFISDRDGNIIRMRNDSIVMKCSFPANLSFESGMRIISENGFFILNVSKKLHFLLKTELQFCERSRKGAEIDSKLFHKLRG